MWAVSEMLDNAKECIFILVRYTLIFSFAEIDSRIRTGGLPLNSTSVGHLQSTQNGGSITYSSAKLNKELRSMFSYTKRSPKP